LKNHFIIYNFTDDIATATSAKNFIETARSEIMTASNKLQGGGFSPLVFFLSEWDSL